MLTTGQGTSISVDLPNHSLHIDNLNTDNVHFKSLICDPSSSCFVLGGSSSAVVNALRLHGVMYEGLNGEARRAALIHHLFYGHCHHRSSTECRAVAQMSTSMASLAASLSEEVLVLFRRSELSSRLFEDLCLLLGFRKDQTRSESKLVAFYEHRLEMLHNPREFYQLSNFISNYDNMDRSTLMSLCGAHGLSSHGTNTDLRDRLFRHICGGRCKDSITSRGDLPPSCENTMDEIAEPRDTSDLATYVLARTVHKMKLKSLRKVADMYNLECRSSDSISKLRRTVKRFICSSLKGKRYLQSIARRRAHNKHEDELHDVRHWWPQVPPKSLTDTLVNDFKLKTSSSELATSVCASCAESTLTRSSTTVPIDELDIAILRRPDVSSENEVDDTSDSDSDVDAGQGSNQQESFWLHPSVTPPIFPYSDGPLKDVLVDPKGVIENDGMPESIILCDSCCVSLNAGRLPALAIANRLFIGEVPDELKDLTTVEESMIGLCRACAIIVQLKDGLSGSYRDDQASASGANLQRALRGHVIVHPQRPDIVSEILPPSIEDIVAPICVVYTGSNAPSADWLRKKARPLAVRADRVRRALIWLKAHNYLYRNITINHGVLDEINSLPSLPVHVEFVRSDDEDDVLTSGYANNADSMDNRNMSQSDGDIPFDSVLIADVDPKASARELRAAAVRHFGDSTKSYLEMPHNPEPENEFCNPALFPKLFPTLFPFGLGGFEDQRRKRPLSFKQQAKHFLNLANDRFQVHHSFTFLAFNIIQRRQVLWQSSAKVKKANFQNTAEIFAGICPEDIGTVTDRFARGDDKTAYSDSERHVLRLMKEVKLVNRHVPGSNAARLAMRNEIRALMLSHGLPSFFITINPADIYNPLVKFLAGGDIDIDNLLPTDIPDYWDQTLLVAKNPVVAAKFFNLYIKAFIKSILGYDPESESVKPGVLGVVKAHYGCVEAQGRGTLHCHMLVWIEGSLDPNKLKERLLREPGGAFEKRLVAYLQDAIQTSIPVFDEEDRPDCDENEGREQADLLEHFHPCLTRGPVRQAHESELSYQQRCAKDLSSLAEACQRHSHRATCYKNWKGPPAEKKCRFELDEANTKPSTFFDQTTGELSMQKLDGMVNNFNTVMLQAVRCNMDIKFIGSGGLAKAALYYITDYISKAQLKAHVAYAALEVALKKLGMPSGEDDDIIARAKRLLTKCANALIGLQELSAPQVASYVLDLEDHFTSHKFRHLYWMSFEAYLDRACVAPDSTSLPLSTTDGLVNDECEPTTEDTVADNDYLRVAVNDEGELVSRGDQIADYMYRSSKLDDVSLWDFVAQVEKVKKRKKKHVDALQGDESSSEEDSPPNIEEIDNALLGILGKRCVHIDFRNDHCEYITHELTIHCPTDRFVPIPIGPSLPRRDVATDVERYCRLMLCFFKPWRRGADLKSGFDSWEHAFAAWKASSEYTKDVEELLSNMQLLHECKDSRDDHFKNRNRSSGNLITVAMIDESRHIEDDDLTASIDEGALHGLLQEIDDKMSNYAHRMNADVSDVIESFEKSGLYCASDELMSSDSFGIEEDVSGCAHNYETAWKDAYEKRKAAWKERESLEEDEYTEESTTEVYNSFVNPIRVREPCVVNNEIRDSHVSDASVPLNENLLLQPVANLDPSDFASSWGLNREQTLAFNIIANKSMVRRGTENPLRMFLSGPAGTGKSRVFNALRSYFESKGQARRFRICSYMGIAAKNVGGMTLHAVLCLGKGKKRAQSKEELISLWNGIDFLLIDEVSMISCEFLIEVSEALSKAKGNTDPFGGINILFAGDFAQLPPVLQCRLYADPTSKYGKGSQQKEKKILGRLLWLMIDTVVELTTNMRQQGRENVRFSELLNRLRVGNCTDADYEVLQSRIVGQNCDIDFDDPKWKSSPIIVSDNSTKDAINERCAIAFAQQTNQTLQWYHATDTCKGAVLSQEDLVSYLHSVHSGKSHGRIGRLPLVLGMPVLVSQNFDVEGGIVNGSYGIVKRIRYTVDENGIRKLTSCVVEVKDSNENTMPYLQAHEVPILKDSIDITFKNRHGSGGGITIRRSQVPIVPAFAMTAHRAQGQTLSNVIVDLQSCRGSEAPYVMLSRVTSLKGLLILRPFERKKISCNISEELRNENRRLRVLAQKTLERYGGVDDDHQGQSRTLTRDHDLPRPPSKRKRI